MFHIFTIFVTGRITNDDYSNVRSSKVFGAVATCPLAVDIFDSPVRVTFILIVEAVVNALVVFTIAA